MSRTSSARRSTTAGTGLPVTLTVLSMASVQLGDALSVSLFDEIGAAGTAWLRLSLGALILAFTVRPRRGTLARAQVLPVVGLGVASAGLTLSFFAALAILPLGVAVALAFSGPLAVALAGGGRSRLWPVLAAAGVVALTQPWHAAVPLVGLLLALISAVCWAVYILLTRQVAAALPGLTGLALSMPLAALCTAPFGARQALAHLDAGVLLRGAGLALLLPVIPYALELVVLRRLPTATFATLMCWEPALAALAGLVVLRQPPTAWQAAGTTLLVVAGLGHARSPAVRPAVRHLDTTHRTVDELHL